MMMQILTRYIPTAIGLVLTQEAMAHPDHQQALQQHSFLSGFLHPFTGADHIVLAIGLGMLCLYTLFNQYRQPAFALTSLRWLVGGCAFIVSLGVGFFLALSGALQQWQISDTTIEQGILASVIVVSVTLVMQSIGLQRAHASIWMWINQTMLAVGLGLAGFHGAAHALEMPSTVNSLYFNMGMDVGMFVLYTCGAMFTVLCMQYSEKWSLWRFLPSFLAGLGLLTVIAL